MLSLILLAGQEEVRLVEHVHGDNPVTYFNIHDDEDTATAATLRFLQQRSGRLVELKQQGERLILGRVGKETFWFDPNRIFTEQGITNTLRECNPESWLRYAARTLVQRMGAVVRRVVGEPAQADPSPQYLGAAPPEAALVVKRFADALLESVLEKGANVLVSVHNNCDGEYSARSYLPQAEDGADAAEVFLAADRDPDDFFFVTDRRLFSDLKARGFNIVLQRNEAVRDDGSLSVYCGRKGIPYADIEAQEGHENTQLEMLEAFDTVLRTLNLQSGP